MYSTLLACAGSGMCTIETKRFVDTGLESPTLSGSESLPPRFVGSLSRLGRSGSKQVLGCTIVRLRTQQKKEHAMQCRCIEWTLWHQKNVANDPSAKSSIGSSKKKGATHLLHSLPGLHHGLPLFPPSNALIDWICMTSKRRLCFSCHRMGCSTQTYYPCGE